MQDPAALLSIMVQLPLQHMMSQFPAPFRCSDLLQMLACRYIRLVSRRVADASLSAEERRQIQDVELRPLGQLLTEAAAAYYTAAADRLRQRQLDITAALGNCPPEISVATAFKVG